MKELKHVTQFSKHFKCDLCDKALMSERGLNMHLKIHEKIPQVDGILDDEQDDDIIKNKEDTNNIDEDKDLDILSDNVKVEMIGKYYYHYCSNCESCDNSLEIMKTHMVSEHEIETLQL